jgi:hypothetical protein
MNLDDLELELRRLPGVVSATFDVHETNLYVQLHVMGTSARVAPGDAVRIAARHTDRPVEVEVIRWRDEPLDVRTTTPMRRRADRGEEREEPTLDITGGAVLVAETVIEETVVETPSVEAPVARGERVRLLAVLSFPESDELEVHLVYAGRRTIGRAPVSRGLAGAVEATIDALRQLGAPTTARTRWARALEGDDATPTLVAVALDDVVDDGRTHYGLASGTSPIDAAARSTLDAVNRPMLRRL